MDVESLATALEREHRQIDAGIESYTAGEPADDLVRAIHALRRHIYLEEEFLFPPLREAGALAPVLVMLREHALMWTTLEELERDLAAGAGSARALCRRLIVQLQHHNPKEERILYPRAEQVLGAPASERLRAFLDSGELPEGWVCHRARP